MTPTVKNNPETSRYELFDTDDSSGRVIGFLQYVREGQHVAVPHTEVDAEFNGQGLGGHLAKAFLDNARDEDLSVAPDCPFVTGYIKRHTEYVDLVPEGERAAYGL